MLTPFGWLRAFTVAFASLFYLCGGATAEGLCVPDSTNSEATSDPTTEECYKAFCALPIEDQRGDIPQQGFSQHIRKNGGVYGKYLQACFSKWSDLQDYSKDFLSDMYGVLFFKDSSGLIPVCSAFRIAQDLVVTARHCIYDGHGIPSPTQFVFRLISAPAQDIPVIDEIKASFSVPKDEIANDFSDYWFLKIAESGRRFNRTREEFKSTVRRGSPLLIGGFNRVAFVLDVNEDEKRWADSFRWTKVWGAQWITVDHPPTPLADHSCIYHKAPTFGGLSGSPIIGSDFDSSGKPLRRFVVGLHLRSGAPVGAYQFDADCGSYPGFNIGLALSAEILQRVTAAPTEVNRQ